MSSADADKRAAAVAAADLVRDGMTVGLGTGSTVAFMLPALAARGLSGMRCVATSVATEEQARSLRLPVESFESGSIDRFDIAIDGADEIAPDGWLIKGGGGAHTREKIVAAAADEFVVIASGDKQVEALSGPVPLELLAYGLAATLRALAELGPVTLRDVARSPDGGVIADFRGPVSDPAVLSASLAAVPGVVEHGLFPPSLVSRIIVAHGEEISERRV